MKNLISLLIAMFAFLIFSFAQNPNHVYVSGYTKSNGTYVAGHYRTAPNTTKNDNFSTYPNVNPYTGKQGTVAPSYNYTNTTTNTQTNSYTNTYNNNYTLPRVTTIKVW